MEQEHYQRPWSQGDLTKLCGIFASINLLRTSLKAPFLTHRYCENLFALGAEYLRRCGFMRGMLKDGISDHQLWLLLRFLCIRIERWHPVRLKLQRPFRKRTEPVPMKMFTDRMAQLLAVPGTAAIIAYETTLDAHYTVVRSVTPSALMLNDSTGITRLLRRSCSTTALALSKGRSKLLHPGSTIILTASARSR